MTKEKSTTFNVLDTCSSDTQWHSKTLYASSCIIIPLQYKTLRVYENHARIKDEILSKVHNEPYVKQERTKCIILINMDNIIKDEICYQKLYLL